MAVSEEYSACEVRMGKRSKETRHTSAPPSDHGPTTESAGQSTSLENITRVTKELAMILCTQYFLPDTLASDPPQPVCKFRRNHLAQFPSLTPHLNALTDALHLPRCYEQDGTLYISLPLAEAVPNLEALHGFVTRVLKLTVPLNRPSKVSSAKPAESVANEPSEPATLSSSQNSSPLAASERSADTAGSETHTTTSQSSSAPGPAHVDITTVLSQTPKALEVVVPLEAPQTSTSEVASQKSSKKSKNKNGKKKTQKSLEQKIKQEQVAMSSYATSEQTPGSNRETANVSITLPGIATSTSQSATLRDVASLTSTQGNATIQLPDPNPTSSKRSAVNAAPVNLSQSATQSNVSHQVKVAWEPLSVRLEVSECAQCGDTGSLKRCGRCMKVQYCSTACQHTAWPQHRIVCAKLKATPAIADIVTTLSKGKVPHALRLNPIDDYYVHGSSEVLASRPNHTPSDSPRTSDPYNQFYTLVTFERLAKDLDDPDLSFIRCGICTRLLFNPMTLPCGHNFCEYCVLRSFSPDRRYCPHCHSRFPGSVVLQTNWNQVLDMMIRFLYPRRYSKRAVQRQELAPKMPFTPTPLTHHLQWTLKVDYLSPACLIVLVYAKLIGALPDIRVVEQPMMRTYDHTNLGEWECPDREKRVPQLEVLVPTITGIRRRRFDHPHTILQVLTEVWECDVFYPPPSATFGYKRGIVDITSSEHVKEVFAKVVRPVSDFLISCVWERLLPSNVLRNVVVGHGYLEQEYSRHRSQNRPSGLDVHDIVAAVPTIMLLHLDSFVLIESVHNLNGFCSWLRRILHQEPLSDIVLEFMCHSANLPMYKRNVAFELAGVMMGHRDPEDDRPLWPYVSSKDLPRNPDTLSAYRQRRKLGDFDSDPAEDSQAVPKAEQPVGKVGESSDGKHPSK